jgi:hypothetical protein
MDCYSVFFPLQLTKDTPSFTCTINCSVCGIQIETNLSKGSLPKKGSIGMNGTSVF